MSTFMVPQPSESGPVYSFQPGISQGKERPARNMLRVAPLCLTDVKALCLMGGAARVGHVRNPRKHTMHRIVMAPDIVLDTVLSDGSVPAWADKRYDADGGGHRC